MKNFPYPCWIHFNGNRGTTDLIYSFRTENRFKIFLGFYKENH